MATMQELRAEAKKAGVPTSEIRSAESAVELQGLIAGYGGVSVRKKSTAQRGNVVVAKKVAKRGPGRPPKSATAKRGPGRPRKIETVAKRGPGRPRKTETVEPVKRGPGRPRKTEPVEIVKKRGPGRPKGSTNKTATKKITNGRLRENVSTDGRHIIEAIDYGKTNGWNARSGSAPDRIVKALRKFRGNREKVFDLLVSDVDDFVGGKLRNGGRRNKGNKEAMLRYRIARTDWDFAIKTGQHKKATDRAEYGTAGFGTGVFKRVSKKSTTKPAAKKVAQTAPKRRGRPPKAKVGTDAPKKRGRPVGSRNKPKVTAPKTGTPATKRQMKRR